MSCAVLYGLVALLSAACTALPVPAQAPAPAPGAAQAGTIIGEIDQLFSWATPETPGCAVAVAQNGDVVVNRAYGLANLEKEEPISASTLFDIGSTQKQFIAAAILLLVEDGRISLADDIHTYFPELPDYGHTITVDHLLTHTSGLRDWTALQPLASEPEDALTLILRQRGLNFAPGEEWSYSNSGYVLLKEIVARTTGRPFSAFAHERLFEPLGMETTTYADDVRDVKDRALAYEQEGGGWRLNILVGNERGDGGALLSTAGDLLTWNEALTNASLGAFVTDKLQEPARLNNGRALSYARGLFLDEHPASTIVWHSGSAAGYKSLLARLPELRLSFAILCNSGEGDLGERYADRIIELFTPAGDEPDAEAAETSEATAPAATTGAAEAQTQDPSSRAGLFFSEGTGEPLRLVVQDGALHIDRGPELAAVAPDRLRNQQRSLEFMSEDQVELHFLSADEIELTTTSGETIRYRRGQPPVLAAAELEDFPGQYASDELGATLDISYADDGLAVRLNGSPPISVMPADRDTFQLGRILVRFRRDEGGRVTALDFSNPVLRSVRFARLSDGG